MRLSRIRDYLRPIWRRLLLVHLAFTLLAFAVLTPLFGLLLRGLLAVKGEEDGLTVDDVQSVIETAVVEGPENPDGGWPATIASFRSASFPRILKAGRSICSARPSRQASR